MDLHFGDSIRLTIDQALSRRSSPECMESDMDHRTKPETQSTFVIEPALSLLLTGLLMIHPIAPLLWVRLIAPQLRVDQAFEPVHALEVVYPQ